MTLRNFICIGATYMYEVQIRVLDGVSMEENIFGDLRFFGLPLSRVARVIRCGGASPAPGDLREQQGLRRARPLAAHHPAQRRAARVPGVRRRDPARTLAPQRHHPVTRFHI